MLEPRRHFRVNRHAEVLATVARGPLGAIVANRFPAAIPRRPNEESHRAAEVEQPTRWSRERLELREALVESAQPRLRGPHVVVVPDIARCVARSRTLV